MVFPHDGGPYKTTIGMFGSDMVTVMLLGSFSSSEDKPTGAEVFTGASVTAALELSNEDVAAGLSIMSSLVVVGFVLDPLFTDIAILLFFLVVFTFLFS